MGLLAACGLGGAGGAHAQAGVTKLLVGATPGGGTDLVARTLAQEMTRLLGGQFIVDNRPGAAGNIAAQQVAQSQPDGSTLLLSYTSHAINASLFPKLPFDTLKDFQALCLVASSPLILVTRPELPAGNVAEVLALARAQPGKLSMAVAGVGSANHLAGEMLKAEGKVDITSVPYKGAGPAVSDVMGGQVDLLMSNAATVQELIRGGKLKALGVSTAKRLDAHPGVPAIAETLPGFDYSSWYGLFAPSGLKPEAAAKLGRAAQQAVASSAVQERLRADGLVPIGSGPEAFDRFVRSEIERWGKVVVATGAKAG